MRGMQQDAGQRARHVRSTQSRVPGDTIRAGHGPDRMARLARTDRSSRGWYHVEGSGGPADNRVVGGQRLSRARLRAVVSLRTS